MAITHGKMLRTNGTFVAFKFLPPNWSFRDQFLAAKHDMVAHPYSFLTIFSSNTCRIKHLPCVNPCTGADKGLMAGYT